MDRSRLRLIRDYLQVYNTVVETCFNHCIASFAEKKVTSDEEGCTERCINKYIGLNHQLMQVFAEIQPIIIQKRMDEMAQMQEAQEAAST